MASAKFDGVNLRIELTHDETVNFTDKVLTGGSASVTAALTAFGVPVFAVGIVAAALALHAAWEIPAIKAADKGQGVFLTAPMFPLAGVVLIPSTRYEFDNDGWSGSDTSVIGSTEGDVIETHIEHGGDPTTVVFRLRNQSPEGWKKAMVLRDGLGAQWWIEASGFSQAENGLWADQVHNGQPLTFWKPKFLGAWTEIFSIHGLEKLAPGSIVNFDWVKD
jgi:hypothetical protein